MGFILNIFFLPLHHQLFSGYFTALDLSAFQSLEHWQSFEVTALPAQGASPVQGEYSVTSISQAARPAAPENLKYVHKQVMKAATAEQESERTPTPEPESSPKSTNTLKKWMSGKNKSKLKESPKEEHPKPPPVCTVALNTHGALHNRIFTGGRDFTISHTPGDRTHDTIINHTEDQGASGSSTPVERVLLVDGTTRLLERFGARGYFSTHGEFSWTEGFGMQSALVDSSKDWHDTMYDNLFGVDCRWSIHAVIGKNADASGQVLLGFVFHQQHTGEAFFVQVFTTQTAPPTHAPPIPPRPQSLPNVAPVPPVATVPDTLTDPLEGLEIHDPPATPDPLENDPTFHEDDSGIDDRSQVSTPLSDRMLTRQNTPTLGSQPGSFNSRGMTIPGSQPRSEGYHSGGTSVHSPALFTVKGNTPDRPSYYTVRVQQPPPPPPPPALPQEPEIPEPLDLREVPVERHEQLIVHFRRGSRASYEESRRDYEQALRDYPQRLATYGGPITDENRKRLTDEWLKAFRAARLNKLGRVPSSCKEESEENKKKPNSTDFDPDGGSGGGFSGGSPSFITTNLFISQ
ncbi:hypothetical protein [Endozoicomonas arenosclerae]|uniref:hypothetical protein n=1 Tax=Endozoicomonas arenosclerae TaxID=1633495 RepID=UPI00078564BF|nr:hypothetical protein [Endozoicomonas arenosclerae]